MNKMEKFQLVDLTQEKLAEVLDKTRWAADMQWQELLKLASVMKGYIVPEGCTLWGEADLERYMCIIAKGRVGVLKSDSKGKKGVIAELGAGQSLGEMSLLDHQPRSAEIVALTELKILVMPTHALDALRDKDPLVAYKFMLKLAQFLSYRLRKTSGELLDFLCFER